MQNVDTRASKNRSPAADFNVCNDGHIEENEKKSMNAKKEYIISRIKESEDPNQINKLFIISTVIFI